MHKEIGSEFWDVELVDGRQVVSEKTHGYLMTGRTALDFIIKDLKASRPLARVCLPTFCCHSMIQPFLDNGVALEFYDVGFEGGRFVHHIDLERRYDALLIMQYFGFCSAEVGVAISRLREGGASVIEDATHSWFSDSPYHLRSDYVFSSFRKWTGVPGGALVLKRGGSFVAPLPEHSSAEYLGIREQAAGAKRRFIEQDAGTKTTFLDLFARAEKMLEEDYQDYRLPRAYQDIIERLDARGIRRTRHANARHLVDGLDACVGLQCPVLTAQDAPLFVPVLVGAGRRNALQRHLIENRVYCPVHWPLSEIHDCSHPYLYEQGLSLVCDQRYTVEDMERIVQLITGYLGRSPA